MSDPTIKPERITRPIQLLAAWLAGLFIVDRGFLVAASNFSSGSWESRALVIAAIANVPLFLSAVFLLQTKFRPELQEDSYYSTYLSQKTNQPIRVSRDEVQVADLRQRLEDLESRIATAGTGETQHFDVDGLLFGLNRHLKDGTTIRAELAKRGVRSVSVFGPPEPPDRRIVSISRLLPTRTVGALVDLAAELGFEGYNLFDKFAEETEEDVLLGSYGKLEFELLLEGGGSPDSSQEPKTAS